MNLRLVHSWLKSIVNVLNDWFIKAARPGTRTLQVEVFPPVHTLTELLRPDWKSYCFGSCIFQIGNCQPESDVLGVNNKRKIYFQGTFTFVVDFHLNPVECSLPPEAIKYGKTPEIMIFEVGSEKGRKFLLFIQNTS